LGHDGRMHARRRDGRRQSQGPRYGEKENAREVFPPGAILRLSRYESRGLGM